ncbi:Ring/U-Box superfamily protein [Parasponia andersonii]|uniref:Ring/U-Box superfamily protein n=1 Tax=Parasponia andersonii TaxID=3476 RepID=A0A2P5C2X5_PARAD|nr:Ring/U-Box superfamily protein [Parasponia andersonii]
MAIAGLHNVSVLDSSFLRDSQTQASREIREEGRVSTRASSLLQMWRELEDEHVVSRSQERFRERLFQRRSDSFIADLSRTDSSGSHVSERTGDSEDASVRENECITWSEDQNGSQNDHEVSSNYNSEHSSDFGEVERGRVRQVFREWMSSGAGECMSNVSHINNSSRAEWLGENEQERVRIIREWVQMNSQLRGTCAGSRENQPPEFGSQIEQVRDGLVVNQNEGRNQHFRRGIRRLCGRQALLDMLKKAERERRMELQGLLEYRAVTNFPHRNRIQSLLRGWFLRNRSLVENERPSSVAESELGLLRQRHTVSGLREGFFSRLDNSVCAQGSTSLSDSSNDDIIPNGNEQPQGNTLYMVRDDFFEQSELTEGSDDREHESHVVSNGRDELGGNAVEDVESRASDAHIVEGWQEEVPDNVIREWQWSTGVEFVGRGDGTEPNAEVDSQETTADEWARDTMQNVVEERRNMREDSYTVDDQSDPMRETNDFPGLSGHAGNLEDDTVANTNRQESASEVQQWPDQSSDNEEGDWERDVAEYTEWRESPSENVDGDQQQPAEFGWSQGNEDRENSHLEDVPEEWHEEGGFQEAVQSWLEVPSDSEAVPARQVDTFYFPDDDNVYSMELRELLSRRRVSNLLHSGFRESLDQLIQSYVERQGHAATDWELDGSSSSPVSVEQDMERASANQSDAQGDAVVRSPVALPSRPIPPPPPIWGQESHHSSWTQHDMHQRFGIEWEIINDMRIDMARLQQRMNNLQRMMETCMDMQLELQRSIRQEVSAALNRSAGSQESCEVDLAGDDSKWDHMWAHVYMF